MSAMQQRTGQRPKFINTNRPNRFNNNYPNKKNFNRFPNNKGTGQFQVTTNGVKPQYGGNRDAVIRQNLEHMKQVAQKKRVAQERYYNGNGRSPMVKSSSGPFTKQDQTNHRASIQQRLSVQQRLGNRGKQNINTYPPKKNFVTTRPNTNQFTTRPNTNQFITRPNTNQFTTRPNTNQFIGGMRSDKITRINNMQQKKTRFRNPAASIKTVNSAGKVVYLQPVRRPANYTVRVENDRKHHVNQGLNPVLQQEIKLIQSKSSRQIVAPPMAPLVSQSQPVQNITNSYEVDRLPIVATARTLHERFSMI